MLKKRQIEKVQAAEAFEAMFTSPGPELISWGPIRWYGLLIVPVVLIGLNLSSQLANPKAGNELIMTCFHCSCSRR